MNNEISNQKEELNTIELKEDDKVYALDVSDSDGLSLHKTTPEYALIIFKTTDTSEMAAGIKHNGTVVLGKDITIDGASQKVWDGFTEIFRNNRITVDGKCAFCDNKVNEGF